MTAIEKYILQCRKTFHLILVYEVILTLCIYACLLIEGTTIRKTMLVTETNHYVRFSNCGSVYHIRFPRKQCI
jgi:hypothetical protein